MSIEDQLPEGIILRAPDGTLQALNLININSAETVMSGWDLDIGYGWSTERLGRFELSASATLLDEYEHRLLPGTPVLDRRGKVENPPDWRGRLTLGWKRSIWSASVSVNHVDRLYNAGVDPRIVLRDVSSQTTVDAQLALTFGKRESSLLDNSSVRVGFMNLFDEKPPFVDSSGGFDVRNHMFEGRQFYVRLSKVFGAP